MHARPWCLGLGLGLLLAFLPARAGAQEKPASPDAPVHASPAPHDAVAVEDAANDQPGGFFTEIGYLLMQPRRRALDFAIVNPSNNGISEGSIESLGWEADSGVRIGGGYRFGGAAWEAGVFYTYLHAHGEETLTSPAGGILYATLTRPGMIQQVDSASGSTGLNYNVLDVEFGRTFVLGECFSLRLFGGGRFAWIDQNLNVIYDGGDASTAQVLSPIDFEGAGLRLGGEGRWNVRWGFNVYARGSASLLAGSFQTQLVETNNAGATVDVNVCEHFNKFVPVFELGLGIGWQYRNFQVSVGYEMVDWLGLVDSPDFTDDVHPGKITRRVSDLSLDGLMFRAGLSF
jgi:hypothetical protein